MRILNRPMFKRGGSTGQGITSGLRRQGYATGLDVQKIKELKEQTLGMYGRPPRGYNTYDFLTDWGLRMVSATPKGNVLQTAAAEAIEPHQKLMAGKSEAEMAEYLSGIKATDQAVSSLTDIAAAEAKANELNKDFSDKRRIEMITERNMTKAQVGTWLATIQGARGSAIGEVAINNLIDRGISNVGMVPNISEEQNFKYDLQSLDPDKIWFNPDKQQWLVVSQVKEDGKIVNKEKTFFDENEAIKFHTQKKTLDNIDIETKTTVTEDGKKQTVQEIEKEKEAYVWKPEDFEPKSSPDVVAEAIKNQEKDYDEVTKFWDWLASEKEFGNYFKKKQDKVTQLPPGLRK